MSGFNKYYYIEHKRRGKPEANEMPIKDFLVGFCNHHHIDYNPYETQVIELWKEYTGTIITKFTTKIYVYKDTLYVYVNNPTVRAELSMVRTAMTNKINDKIGKKAIKDIIIK
jgi:hypothetical protein